VKRIRSEYRSAATVNDTENAREEMLRMVQHARDKQRASVKSEG
jgi:hypothetical protein